MKRQTMPVSHIDLDLCFRALRLPFDATPEEVDRAYTTYMAREREKLLSPDPVLREQAHSDMELIADLYGRISRSVTYAQRLEYAASLDGCAGGFTLSAYAVCFTFGAVLTFGAWYLLI